MTMILQQLAYQYETEKAAETAGADDGALEPIGNAGQQSLQQYRQTGTVPPLHQRGERDETLSCGYAPEPCDHAVQQRDNKMQLQQHERDQHLHQLQSINNLLLDLPTTPTSGTYPSLKYSHDVTSPTSKNAGSNLENMSISDLFGLGLPRGSLMGAGQKEENGHTNFDAPAYRNLLQQQQRENSNGYYSNSNLLEQHDGNGNNWYYSNSNNLEVPSSPISVTTPASPSTPGSSYSNPYSYSSVNSSPYTSASSVTSGYNKQFSPPSVRSPCYGRAIRGSPPYSDCGSPSVEHSPHVFGCNGSRSDSPADSENSVNSIDGPLSDIMNYLSLNSGQHRCFVPNPNSLLEAEKYFQNVRPSVADLQRVKKALHNTPHHHQQQSPTSTHSYHHHNHSNSRHSHSQQHNSSGPFNNNNNNNNVKCSAKKNYYVESPECATSSLPSQVYPSHWALDKAVRCHRNAAASSYANHTWSGTLPQRTQKPVGYSTKVFFGGVPWDITESNLISTFKQFGQIKIEWPGKDHETNQPKGYVYIIFESEKQVKSLLSCCTHDFSNGGSYYFKISSKRMKGKQVQVIPWALNDSNYVKSSSQKLDPEKTVFVGALHGMITASGLAKVMNDLFDNVIYAGIDTDKHKYPIGSARVTFWSKQSFNKAINAAFVEIKTTKFAKKVQIDPYIEDAPCSSCYVQQGPYFCRESTCFKYYCHTCWQWVHNNDSKFWHKPMSRGLKNQVIGLTPSAMMRRSSHLL